MNADGGNRPLRILYSHYLHDENHPATQMAHAISRELRGLGNDVLVHRCRGPVGFEKSERSPAKEADRTLRARIRDKTWFARALYKNRAMYARDLAVIERFRPDIVLGREDSYWFSMAIAAKKTGTPLITFADVPVSYETRLFHSGERWNPPGVVEFVERWWLKHSKAVITVCRPAAEELRKLGLKTPIHVAWNGVDPTRFPEISKRERVERLAELGLPTNKTIVGFQGSFRNFHGIDLLRDVMLATSSRDDLHWLLVGDGPERTPLEAAVAGRVSATFLGRRPPESMGGLVGLFDIAMTSHLFVEGAFYFCPLKILESAAAGCAVIASDQGDIPLLLDEGRAGVLVGDPSPRRWTKELEDLLDHPDRIRELGASARAWVGSNFTWRRTAERVETVLREALEDPGAVACTPHFSIRNRMETEATRS